MKENPSSHSEIFFFFFKISKGNFLAVQWLGIYSLTAKGPGLIPCLGTRILWALWWGKEKKKRLVKDNLTKTNYRMKFDFLKYFVDL